jgi:hypothetical protein
MPAPTISDLITQVTTALQSTYDYANSQNPPPSPLLVSPMDQVAVLQAANTQAQSDLAAMTLDDTKQKARLAKVIGDLAQAQTDATT